jgi:hypothetical protein
MEGMMKTLSILAGIATIALASSGYAAHLDNLDTPYESRGACESAVAGFNSDVRDPLLDIFLQRRRRVELSNQNIPVRN